MHSAAKVHRIVLIFLPSNVRAHIQRCNFVQKLVVKSMCFSSPILSYALPLLLPDVPTSANILFQLHNYKTVVILHNDIALLRGDLGMHGIKKCPTIICCLRNTVTPAYRGIS